MIQIDLCIICTRAVRGVGGAHSLGVASGTDASAPLQGCAAWARAYGVRRAADRQTDACAGGLSGAAA
eukprot:scaffold908_cov333-Prasinococcus_capsulatus_cf.AAC.3